MFDGRVIPVAVIALWASQAVAGSVHVSLESPAGMPATGAGRPHVHAVRAVSSSDNGAQVEG